MEVCCLAKARPFRLRSCCTATVVVDLTPGGMGSEMGHQDHRRFHLAAKTP
jgi:hypothetical protein